MWLLVTAHSQSVPRKTVGNSQVHRCGCWSLLTVSQSHGKQLGTVRYIGVAVGRCSQHTCLFSSLALSGWPHTRSVCCILSPCGTLVSLSPPVSVFVSVSLFVCFCLCVSVCLCLSVSPSQSACTFLSLCECQSPPPPPLPPPSTPSFPTVTCLSSLSYRLVGPVVKAFASGAEDPGFESRLRRGFFFRGRVIPVT